VTFHRTLIRAPSSTSCPSKSTGIPPPPAGAGRRNSSGRRYRGVVPQRAREIEAIWTPTTALCALARRGACTLPPAVDAGHDPPTLLPSRRESDAGAAHQRSGSARWVRVRASVSATQTSATVPRLVRLRGCIPIGPSSRTVTRENCFAGCSSRGFTVAKDSVQFTALRVVRQHRTNRHRAPETFVCSL
jgi:hypothetical protein